MGRLTTTPVFRTTPARANIIYLSFGPGPHLHETLFSILTMRRFGDAELRDVHSVVVTDQVEFFRPFEIETLPVSAEQMKEWKGPRNVWSRPKILALMHAAEMLQGTNVMVDGDTVFREPPRRMLERVSPGRSVMHMREGILGASRHPGLRQAGEELELAQPRMSDGRALGQGRRTMMWNAGVIGIAPEDRKLLDEVLTFTDFMVARFYLTQWEQLGFGVVQAAATEMFEVRDVISHYCVSPKRKPFRARLPEMIEQAMKMSPEQRANFLYEQRIRMPIKLRVRVMAKDLANLVGVMPRRDRFDCV